MEVRPVCPECGAARVSKNGIKLGRQNFVCQKCGRQFLAPKDGAEPAPSSAPVERLDKKVGEFDWRKWSAHIIERQGLHEAASWSQEEATVKLPAGLNVAVLKGLADAHIGNIGTDYASLVDFTDSLLSTPSLFAFLLGDEQDNFVSFKNQLAVLQQILTPEEQDEFVESWLGEIAPKVLFATWGNHAEFEEKSGGRNSLKKILNRNVSYFNGIGICYINFGGQSYKIVATHRTRYNSSFNKTHGLKQLARREIPDADAYVAGHIHEPAYEISFERGREQAYIIHGSLKRNDGFARRYFSFFAAQRDAAITLDSRRHELIVWPSLELALHYAEGENKAK